MADVTALGNTNYLIDTAQTRYYVEGKGGEPPGYWLGGGSEILGRGGATVTAEDFKRLCGGEAMDGMPLVQNHGEEDRDKGWEVCFKTPKSFSELWAVSDAETKQVLRECLRESVTTMVGYIETNAIVSTRRGHGGQTSEPAKLIAAAFEHGTSRALDPNLHTHVVIFNACIRNDGTTGTVTSHELYRWQGTLRSLHRAELGSLVKERLGVELERNGRYWEIANVPQEVRDFHSKRSQELHEFLGDRRYVTAAAAEYAALATRVGKEEVPPRAELFRRWEEEAASLGFTREQARALLHRAEVMSGQEKGAILRDAVTAAVETHLENYSTFSKRQILQKTAVAVMENGISASAINRAVTTHLTEGQEVVRLGEWKGETRYTTQAILDLERDAMAMVERAKGTGQPFHQVSEVAVERALASRPTISDEQAKTVHHLCRGPDQIGVLIADAGTGKTFTASAVAEAHRGDHWNIIGAAPTGKAAQNLEREIGVESYTVHRLLADLEKGRGGNRITLDSQTVLIVDEAGMIGSAQMYKILSACESAGAKLILIGDPKQLQPVSHGCMLKNISENLGYATLHENRRQREGWARDAVGDLAEGRVNQALLSFAERGRLVIERDERATIDRLVSDYCARGGLLKPEETLVLCGTNYECAVVNREVQGRRREEGHLRGPGLAVGGDLVAEGDRVLMTRNNSYYGVRNGQIGTILKADPLGERLTVRLDDGGTVVSLPTAKYDHIKLGYAITTHKSQGTTIENTLVLAGGMMQDKELTYVQLTRARGETFIYADRANAGEAYEGLVKQMSASRAKGLAIDVLREGPAHTHRPSQSPTHQQQER